MKEIKFTQNEATEICIDNKSAIALGKNLVYHHKSNNIDVHFVSIWQYVKNKDVKLKYIKWHDQVADIITKPIVVDLFTYSSNYL